MAQHLHSQLPERRHIIGRVSRANPLAVFLEGHIQHPRGRPAVQAVFDAPVPPDQAVELLGRKIQVAQVVARFGAGLFADLAAGLNPPARNRPPRTLRRTGR